MPVAKERERERERNSKKVFWFEDEVVREIWAKEPGEDFENIVFKSLLQRIHLSGYKRQWHIRV